MSRSFRSDFSPVREVPRQTRPCRRRGVAMVLALLCLVISTSLMANIAKAIRLDHRQRATHQRSLQTTWLCRHGLDVAMQDISSDQSYPGSEWKLTIPNTNLTGHINVVANHKAAGEVSLIVTAKYPYNHPDQIVKTLMATIPSANEKADSE